MFYMPLLKFCEYVIHFSVRVWLFVRLRQEGACSEMRVVELRGASSMMSLCSVSSVGDQPSCTLPCLELFSVLVPAVSIVSSRREVAYLFLGNLLRNRQWGYPNHPSHDSKFPNSLDLFWILFTCDSSLALEENNFCRWTAMLHQDKL